jgi:DNA-binding beta-propeller fold protein YncE
MLRNCVCCLGGTLTVCLGLSAADQKPKLKKESPQPALAPPDLVWPLPPDPPRIRWLAEYTDLAKVKKPVSRKSSWMDKLTGTKTIDETQDLRKPYGVTTDKRGRIYAADTERKVVFVIDPAARSVETREGNSRVPLAMPAGVAVDSANRLFVSDAALHSILCFSSKGELVAHFGTAALGRPGGITVDSSRKRLYVADAKDSRIAVFDIDSFKLIGYFGHPSKTGERADGAFAGPTNVAVDRKGMIYVADTLNYRVQILDPEGKFVRAFGAQGDRPGEFIRPKGIAVDSEGHVYVADAEFNNFQILTAEGQPLLAVGTLGTQSGQFALIAGLYVDSENRIFTTEMFPGRIQVFQYIPQPPVAGESGGPRDSH